MSNNSRKTAITVGAGVALGGLLVALFAEKLSRGHQPLSLKEWQSMLNDKGQITDFPKFLARVSHRGVAAEARRQVWPYLLGLFEPSMSRDDVASVTAAMEDGLLKLLDHCTELQSELQRSSGQQLYGDGNGPLRTELAQFKEAQRVIVLDAVRTNFVQPDKGAVTTGASNKTAPTSSRARVSEPAGPSTGAEQQPGAVVRTLSGSRPLERPPWLSAPLWEEIVGREHLSDSDRRQVLRLCSILTAYAVRDPEIGYCQGMSDLASAFVMIFNDDALAFWGFERFMRRVRANYKIDDFGYRAVTSALYRTLQEVDFVLHSKLRQLGSQECMFAFRMVMCALRREMPLESALAVWEVLWADDLTRRESEEPGTSPTSPSPTPGRGGPDPQSIGKQYLETPRWSTPRMHGTPRTGGEGATPRVDTASSPEGSVLRGGGSAGTSAHVTPRPVTLDADLFVYILAAVATSQRRRVLDDCASGDDVSRVFFSPLRLNVWRVVEAARAYRQQMRKEGERAAPAQGPGQQRPGQQRAAGPRGAAENAGAHGRGQGGNGAAGGAGRQQGR